MGYRLRLGKISKEDYEKYKDMTIEELCKEFPDEDAECFPYYSPPFHTELWELGKYLDYQAPTSFYSNIDLDDEEFQIVDKEFLRMIIEDYRNKIISFYRNDLNSIATLETLQSADNILANKGFNEVFNRIRRMASEWIDLDPLSLDEPRCDFQVTTSWKYEYSIFNLVNIYRNFDWENNLLIYSGW